jgi:hypothetical protein
MVSNLRIRVLGLLLLAIGVLALLWGVCTWNKQLLATGLIACLIGGTLAYYAWRTQEKK